MRKASYPSRLAPSLASTILLGVACGGDPSSAPKTQDDAEAVQEKRYAQGIQTSSEIGGLNEEQVDAAFKSALGSLEKCLAEGAERVEFLGGSVGFFLKIGADGQVSHAHVEKSTLGDRQTEKCMLSALRRCSWPKPVGGDYGLARKSFEFDAPNDVRPPTPWDSEQLDSGLSEIEEEVSSCKGSKGGTFEATIYVATDGSLLSASVTPPDEDGEEAVDCLVDALKAARFTSPGSWPAKATFSL